MTGVVGQADVKMIRTTFILLITLELLFACSHSSQEDETKGIGDTNDTIENVSNRLEPEIQESSNTVSVRKIVAVIDSIYGVEVPLKIDTISDWTIPDNQKYELGPKGLNLSGLEEYYRYFSYQILLFKDSLAAREQFNRISEAAASKQLGRTVQREELFWKLFSKAGSAYTLYKNVIIYHHRRCDYNERIETPREDKFLEYLFNDDSPEDTYFVRVKCGWGHYEER